MTFGILITALVLILCLVSGKLSAKLGMPVLLMFLALGMLFGSDGLFKIHFDDFPVAEEICSLALVFIMFYGGFGTNWKAARPVAAKSILMSTAGVVLTAGLTGLFCWFVLKMSLLEGMLIGAVVGSTDAASVFSILRSKKLNLKNGLASFLELESGSNDPTAYMLTVTLLSLLSGSKSTPVWYLILSQIFFGAVFGIGIAFLALFILRKINFEVHGLMTVFVTAIALLSYAAPTLWGGNGYLSAYLTGIILGNSKIVQKAELVHFFDGITWIMQMTLFFVLGLLSFPSRMPSQILPAVTIFLFLTFVARPAATFSLLSPFRVPFRQQLLIAWAGLRGAASIVFAIFAVNSEAIVENDIFHIIFCVCLLSVALQGTLLPAVAKKLKLVDNNDNILKTFNDYQDDADVHLAEIVLPKEHPWAGRQLQEITLPGDGLVVMIDRGGNLLIPRGSTILQEEDVLIVSQTLPAGRAEIKLDEIGIDERHEWVGRSLEQIDLPQDMLVIAVKRGNGTLVPRGDTIIETGDVIVVNSMARLET